jgi:hypothetical protein
MTESVMLRTRYGTIVRISMFHSLRWGGGYLLGGIGVLTHTLWLVYLGYGVIGGCGLGLGYVSPVSTLIRWFPDRCGLATGLAITSLREHSLNRALHDLAAKLDPVAFQQAFGAGIDRLDTLIAERTVTLGKLLEIAPPGTPDPTSGLYNTTMMLMAGLLALASIANATMRPVHARHHLPAEPEKQTVGAA